MFNNTTGKFDNSNPVDYRAPEFRPIFEKLQGNILKGHGRDFSVNVFLAFKIEGKALQQKLAELSREYVTSAFKQLEEAEQFSRLNIPGSLFGNLMLTRRAYTKLGRSEAELRAWFSDEPENPNPVFPQQANFLSGMRAASADLGDPTPTGELEPLEQAYLAENIDALLLLADDSEEFLLRKVRELVTSLESSNVATVLAVEIGRALRTDDGEGIEHFGYVDGRSQPLFLKSDFRDLAADGSIDISKTTEKVNDKAIRRESGALDFWNPFAQLDLALLPDLAAKDDQAFGSYFVFRKLEQDVLRFTMAEQGLADALGLQGADRERAGAMAVGRFRDGTPLTLGENDGAVPAKSNNFRYDGLNANLDALPLAPKDRLGLKCPFQAHIRKSNPRQSLNALDDDPAAIGQAEAGDRGRRIVRRGIPFGKRVGQVDRFQVLDDLPSKGVGLLFACFQRSITRQFGFMQKTWVNNVQFKLPLGQNPALAATGIDPLIGQPLAAVAGLNPNPSQNWRKEYDGAANQTEPTKLTDLSLAASHPIAVNFQGFIKFRGGEFFFAPSLPFLLGPDGAAGGAYAAQSASRLD